MLKCMRKGSRVAMVAAVAITAATIAMAADASLAAVPASRPRQAAVAPAQTDSGSPLPQQSPAQPGLQTVVLDAAHGGTDEGAHGAGGILEKDVVLALAQTVQARLQKDGWKVVETRTGDQTVSFAQRAAIANAQPNAVFISLDVGSSGSAGSAYVYYYDFSQVIENHPETTVSGLVDWDRAQLDWEPLSRRLAQLLQVELAGRLRGSPELPTGAPVYQLREVAEPAIAVEIENVNAASEAKLDALGKPLAASISEALQAFRVVYRTKAP